MRTCTTPSANGARGCRFERCAFDLLDGYAVDVVGGARDVVFSHCSFADLGAGAVRIDGGRFDAAPRTQTRGIVVEDCEIGPYGRDWASGEGVLVKNAAQCRIAHNRIHDGYYTGVSLGWSWGYGDSVARDNVVEYNLIEDIGKEMLNEEAAAKHPKEDHWLRHYVGTLTNVRPPDSARYFHC